MKVYIAGPMRGYPEYNFPAFDYAARRLRQAGHECINPAELDRVVDIHEWTDPLPKGFMRGAMRRDLIAICDSAEGIVLLPGWRLSSGVGVEKALCDLLDLPSFHTERRHGGTTPLNGYMTEILLQMETLNEPSLSNT